MESVRTPLGQRDLKMLMLPFKNLFTAGEISGAPSFPLHLTTAW